MASLGFEPRTAFADLRLKQTPLTTRTQCHSITFFTTLATIQQQFSAFISNYIPKITFQIEKNIPIVCGDVCLNILNEK